MKAFRIVLIIVVVVLLATFSNEALAQCAMCKATVADKAEGNLAEGLNKGILYLMAFPYLIFGTIAFFWYRASKK